MPPVYRCRLFLILVSENVVCHLFCNPNIDIIRVSKGYDAFINWSDLLCAIEFKYDEGFEFEKIIAFTELDEPRQQYVQNQNPDAAKVVIEKVYSLRKISYEAYYYDNHNNLIKKIKFP